jgi:hypothetical protein
MPKLGLTIRPGGALRESGPRPPVPLFSVSTNGLTATFTDQSSDGRAGGSIAAWDWDFGDGSAHGITQHPVKLYAGAGVKQVTLTVTDDDGLQASLTLPVTVATTTLGRRVGVYQYYDDTTVPNVNVANLNFDHSATTPGTLPARIADARARDVGLFIPIPGGAKAPFLTNNEFDHGKWSDVLETFNTPACVDAVGDALEAGFPLLINMMDEPYHHEWGDVLTKALLTTMAGEIKAIFGNNCPVWIAGGPLYDWHADEVPGYGSTIDGVSYQWDSWRNTHTAMLTACKNQAAADGHHFSIGCNLLNGGLRMVCSDPDGSDCCPLNTTGGPGQNIGGDGRWLCKVHATQMQLAAIHWLDQGARFFISWKWDSVFMAHAGNQQAFANIRAHANTKPTLGFLRSDP